MAKPNITEAESFPEAQQDMWPQAKYHRSVKDVKEKSRRDRDRRERDPPDRGVQGVKIA